MVLKEVLFSFSSSTSRTTSSSICNNTKSFYLKFKQETRIRKKKNDEEWRASI